MNGKKAGVALLCTGAAVCLMGNLGLAGYQIVSSTHREEEILRYVDKELERQAEENKKENTYQEDGFVVGESYEIRSTKQISDAYLSGDSSQLSDEDKETLAMAKEVLERETKKCKNSYEKELAVYNWMYKNIGQGESSTITLPTSRVNDYTPYGVLKGKNAVCVGYATTFRLFMQMLGLECHIVHNDYHSWDLVKLDDGQWYHVDIYTDVSETGRYSNFNMTDSNAVINFHEWDGSALPEAKGTKYSYPMQNAQQIKDMYQIPSLVKKAAKKKKTGVYFSFAEKLSDKDVEAIGMMMDNVRVALESTTDYGSSLRSSWWEDGADSYVLAVNITYSTEDESMKNYEVDQKVRKQVRKAVEQVFGVDLDELDTVEESEDVG